MIHMLHRANVRPSVHRLAVLEYVANHRTHPTADEVFNRIALDFPNVSRTTVYNSLHTLVDAGVLRELEIESSSNITIWRSCCHTVISGARLAAVYTTWLFLPVSTKWFHPVSVWSLPICFLQDFVRIAYYPRKNNNIRQIRK